MVDLMIHTLCYDRLGLMMDSANLCERVLCYLGQLKSKAVFHSDCHETPRSQVSVLDKLTWLCLSSTASQLHIVLSLKSYSAERLCLISKTMSKKHHPVHHPRPLIMLQRAG